MNAQLRQNKGHKREISIEFPAKIYKIQGHAFYQLTKYSCKIRIEIGKRYCRLVHAVSYMLNFQRPSPFWEKLVLKSFVYLCIGFVNGLPFKYIYTRMSVERQGTVTCMRYGTFCLQLFTVGLSKVQNIQNTKILKYNGPMISFWHCSFSTVDKNVYKKYEKKRVPLLSFNYARFM